MQHRLLVWYCTTAVGLLRVLVIEFTANYQTRVNSPLYSYLAYVYVGIDIVTFYHKLPEFYIFFYG